MQVLAADTERVVDVLMWTCPVSVERDGEALNTNSRHRVPPCERLAGPRNGGPAPALDDSKRRDLAPEHRAAGAREEQAASPRNPKSEIITAAGLQQRNAGSS